MTLLVVLVLPIFTAHMRHMLSLAAFFSEAFFALFELAA